MTTTDLALAVDRLARRVKPTAVYGTDYSFGPEPRPAPAPLTPEERAAQAKLTPAEREKAMQDRLAALPKPVFGIRHWDAAQLGPQPTEAQIEAEANAPDPKAALAAARAQMHDMFASLPVNTRAALLTEFSAINDALDRGDIAAARVRVSNVTRPDSSELSVDQFAAAKTAMLALFPA